MYPATVVTSSADKVAIAATAAKFTTLLMAIGHLYRFCADTNAWICQGIADTVFTAASSVFTTAAPHKLVTGRPVQLTAGSALPTNLAAATTYFAIYLTDTTFALATTRALALAGTAIVTSDDGSGTLTVKTVATVGAGSMYVAAGDEVPLNGSLGTTLSVVRNTADGSGSLAEVQL